MEEPSTTPEGPEQSEGPSPLPGSEHNEGPSPLQGSVAGATERIQVIVEAAERAAAGVIEDAEVQARRYLEESRDRADRIAGERARALTEITDALIRQAGEVKRQSDELIAALDRARAQLEGGGDVEGPVPATLRQASEPARAVPHLKPLESPAGGRDQVPSAGARLLATQMAVAGSSRDEIEQRLRTEFGIDEAGPILDSVLGPEAQG